MKTLVKLVGITILLTVLFTSCSHPYFPDPLYIPTARIEGVPESGIVGEPLTLTGTIRPVFASNVEIIWSVKDTGTTGANLSGNILTAGAVGAVVVTARVPNGTAEGKDLVQDFKITFYPAGTQPPVPGDNGGSNTPNVEYTIVITMLDNVTGDSVTVSPDKGKAGVTVTLTYTDRKSVV